MNSNESESSGPPISKGKIEREIENLSKARLEKSETLFFVETNYLPRKKNVTQFLLNFDV
jgi:hypothetical protein